MNLKPPANANYAAVVVRLTAVNTLDGCDNIKGAPVLGFQAIVSSDHKPGDVGVVFTAETELSEEFARLNNLHRHDKLNASPGVTGYLSDDRRVKALKLRGHRSDALFLPLTSLGYTGVAHDLEVGDTFDELNGYAICKKYERVNPRGAGVKATTSSTGFIRVDDKFLPMHFDTTRYRGNERKISPDARVIVTQKLHGVSVRVANTIVKRKPTWRDMIASRVLKVPVVQQGYDMVYGSRKVIKDANSPYQSHDFESDIWTQYGHQLDGIVPQGFAVYGELIGWTSAGAPLQKNYTYDVPKGTAQLYVYRVTQVNPQGIATDLAWGQLVEWCAQLGLKTVPVLTEMAHKAFDPSDWLDRRYYDEGYGQAVPLSGSKKLVDEGVCVRADGLTPTILKAKSPLFLQYETKTLDDETAVDLEAVGGAL